MRKLAPEYIEQYIEFYNMRRKGFLYESSENIAFRFLNAVNNMSEEEGFQFINIYGLSLKKSDDILHQLNIKYDGVFQKQKTSRKKKQVGDVFAFKLEGEAMYSFIVYLGQGKFNSKEIYYVVKKQSKDMVLNLDKELDYDDLLMPFPVNYYTDDKMLIATNENVELAPRLGKVVLEEKFTEISMEKQQMDNITILDNDQSTPYNVCSPELKHSISYIYYLWRYYVSEKYSNEEQRKLFLCAEYDRKITKEEQEAIKKVVDITKWGREEARRFREENILSPKMVQLLHDMLDNIVLPDKKEKTKKEETKDRVNIEYEDNGESYEVEVNYDNLKFIDEMDSYIKEKYEDEITGGDLREVITTYLKESGINMDKVKMEGSTSFLTYESQEKQEIEAITNKLNELFNNKENVKVLCEMIMKNLR